MDLFFFNQAVKGLRLNQSIENVTSRICLKRVLHAKRHGRSQKKGELRVHPRVLQAERVQGIPTSCSGCLSRSRARGCRLSAGQSQRAVDGTSKCAYRGNGRRERLVRIIFDPSPNESDMLCDNTRHAHESCAITTHTFVTVMLLPNHASHCQ